MRRSGYGDGHVPGAVYLAPDAIREAKRPPTFLPSPAEFERMMAELGISNSTRVIVYDVLSAMPAREVHVVSAATVAVVGAAPSTR